jgi:hypothetical protein
MSRDFCITHLGPAGCFVDAIPIELEERRDGLPEDHHEKDDRQEADKFADAAHQRQRIPSYTGGEFSC